MESAVNKFGIFFVGILIAKFLPASFTYVLVFILGIIFTVGLQILAFFYYVIHKSPEFNSNPSAPINRRPSIDPQDLSIEVSTPKKFELGKYLIRKFSLIQCFCTHSKFSTLLSGSDSSLDDLSTYFKDLLSTQKKFGLGLIKIGEIGLLEKLKSNKIMRSWKLFREFCLDTGKYYASETEIIIETLCPKILKFSKELEKKFKDLKNQLKLSGEKFSNLTGESQKIIPKLRSLIESLNKANEEFDEVKKDLAKFETLVKKEMKVKRINNEIQILKTQLVKVNENLAEESKKYVPKASEVLMEFGNLQKVQARQFKSFFENWLVFQYKIFEFSLGRLEKALVDDRDEESKSTQHPSVKQTVAFFKKAFTSTEKSSEIKSITRFFSSFTGSENQNSAFKLAESKSAKLESKVSDLKKFLSIIQNVQEDMQKEHLRVFESWKVISNYYIEDSITQIIRSLKEMYGNNSEFIVGYSDCTQLIHEFSERIQIYKQDSFLNDNSLEDHQQAESRYKDLKKEFLPVIEATKSKMLTCFRNTLYRYKDTLQRTLSLLEIIEDREESLSFQSSTKDHSIRCPYFLANFEEKIIDSGLTQEPKKVGKPESAVWLNDLLRTFISEWRYSPKFIKYMCNKLQKGLNKDNPEYIGEITVSDIEVGSQTPELKDLIALQTTANEFLYEFDLWFRGDVKVTLEFELKFSVAAVLVNVKVVLRSFYAKLRFFYAQSSLKPSWYSFVSEPVHQISLEPVLGKMNKIALNKIPQINTILVSMLTKKFRKYVWPHKRSIKIFKGQKSLVPLS